MKISYNWLKTLINIELSPEKAGELLTNSGLEIEHIETVEAVKGGLEGLVTGFVTERIQHPNADRLSLTKVDIGGPELLSIVCGAPNVEAGQKVVIAPVGVTVHPVSGESFKIKEAKIRGELSQGMICAEDEISLGASHDGIMILPSETPVGISVKELFKMENDAVLEIGLTANRGDAASHLGVARELSALLNIPYSKPEINNLNSTADAYKIIIEDTLACPRYSGLAINGVTVGESPEWLKKNLKAIGINPVNNIADITNYVLHELGQPLHAFDADKITDKTITVKRTVAGTKLITLDGIEQVLNDVDLVISDTKNPLALAGIYGGKNSGITNETKNIFIESAYFDPGTIRKTAKQKGISTDASFRFERGCDPEITVFALQRCAYLILQIAGGEIASKVYDVYDEPVKPFDITLRKLAIKKVSGFEIPDDRVTAILNSLDIKILSSNENEWHLSVPAFRSDVTREIDVIEELMRLYGYENVPLSESVRSSLSYSQGPDKHKLENKAALFLKNIGFNEIMNNSLTKEKYYTGETDLVSLLNPLSQDMSVMRKSMLYGGLETIAYNRNRKNNDLKLFEFGKTYTVSGDNKFNEHEHLSLFVCGNIQNETWQSKSTKADYFYVKEIVQKLTQSLGIKSNFNDLLISFNEVDSKTLKQFDITGTQVIYTDIDWKSTIKASGKSKFILKELPIYPVVRRDLSLVMNKSVTFEQIKALAFKSNSKKLIDINVFDVYEGKPLNEDQKSYSVSFMLYDNDKTMSDKDIDGIMNNLIRIFENDLDAIIRK